MNPCPLQWKHRVPITGSPEKCHPFSSVFFLIHTLGMLTVHLLNKLQASFSALFILYDAVFWPHSCCGFFFYTEFCLCNIKSFPLLLMNFESWLKTSPHLGSRRIHLCFLLNSCMVGLLKLSSKEATQLQSRVKIWTDTSPMKKYTGDGKETWKMLNIKYHLRNCKLKQWDNHHKLLEWLKSKTPNARIWNNRNSSITSENTK